MLFAVTMDENPEKLDAADKFDNPEQSAQEGTFSQEGKG
jgi:hypothetical protein